MMKNAVNVRLISKRDVLQRQAVFRLRYHIYNNILKHYHRVSLNHEQQFLTDALDDKSDLFITQINNKLVGTLRVTAFDRMEQHENVMLKYFATDIKQLFPEPIALFSMFCILPEYNNSIVTKNLTKDVLIHLAKKNIQRVFVETPDYLFDYYQHYQFTQCSNWIQPEGYPFPMTAMTIRTELLMQLD